MVYRDESLVVAQAEWKGPIRIPDADPEGGVARSALRIADIGVTRRVQLEVDLRHPSISDVSITLVGPSGARALVYTQFPASEARHALRFDSDNFARLEALLGEPSAGVWQLHVRDSVAKDVGTLDRWAITVEIALPSRS